MVSVSIYTETHLMTTAPAGQDSLCYWETLKDTKEANRCYVLILNCASKGCLAGSISRAPDF